MAQLLIVTTMSKSTTEFLEASYSKDVDTGELQPVAKVLETLYRILA